MNDSSENPLHSLAKLGQSIWFNDFLHSWLQEDTLTRLINEDKVSGVTSNHVIFEKVIAEIHEYDQVIVELSQKKCNNVQKISETLVVENI